MVDIYASAGRLEVGGWVPTENTPGHVEFLRASPQDWVDRYYTWVRLSRCFSSNPFTDNTNLGVPGTSGTNLEGAIPGRSPEDRVPDTLLVFRQV